MRLAMKKFKLKNFRKLKKLHRTRAWSLMKFFALASKILFNAIFWQFLAQFCKTKCAKLLTISVRMYVRACVRASVRPS
jgi:hypothetical protein